MIDRIRGIAMAHAGREGPLLPILHDIQAAFGHVPPAAAGIVAEVLNISRAEVHGVASFYHDLRNAPAARRVVRLCRGEACQSQGGRELAEIAHSQLGVGWGETTEDGETTLEAVYCLGLCSCAPAGQVDGVLVGRLDAKRLAAALGEAGA